jgi:hypothetical protein
MGQAPLDRFFSAGLSFLLPDSLVNLFSGQLLLPSRVSLGNRDRLFLFQRFLAQAFFDSARRRR